MHCNFLLSQAKIKRGAFRRDDLHTFEVEGQNFLYDRLSGLFFEMDAPGSDALEWLRSGASDAGLDVLRMNHGRAPVGEALAELAVLASHAGAQPDRADGHSARPPIRFFMAPVNQLPEWFLTMGMLMNTS